MRRFWNFFFALIVVLAVTTGVSAQTPDPVERNAGNAAGYVPKWNIGDKWYLEASYKDLKTQGEPWLPPVVWVFEVKSKKNIHRQDCYVVHVYSRNRNLKMQAVLYLSTIDLRPMKVIDICPTMTGVKSQEREIDPFNPEPLINDATLIPYDLPVFPLIRASVQRSDGFGAYGPTAGKEYKKVRKVGGLKFKKTMKQTGKVPDRQHADALSAYRTGGEAFQVELVDGKTASTLTQIWQEGSSWAVTSDSSSRKVRLLPPSAPESLPQAPNRGGDR